MESCLSEAKALPFGNGTSLLSLASGRYSAGTAILITKLTVPCVVGTCVVDVGLILNV